MKERSMVDIATKTFLALLLTAGLSGCSATLSPYFVQSVREHREDTLLVNQSLVRTFQEEMDNDERPEAKAAFQEIINNLNTVSRQSEILEKYVWNEITEEELILVLRSRWRIQ